MLNNCSILLSGLVLLSFLSTSLGAPSVYHWDDGDLASPPPMISKPLPKNGEWYSIPGVHLTPPEDSPRSAVILAENYGVTYIVGVVQENPTLRRPGQIYHFDGCQTTIVSKATVARQNLVIRLAMEPWGDTDRLNLLKSLQLAHAGTWWLLTPGSNGERQSRVVSMAAVPRHGNVNVLVEFKPTGSMLQPGDSDHTFSTAHQAFYTRRTVLARELEALADEPMSVNMVTQLNNEIEGKVLRSSGNRYRR